MAQRYQNIMVAIDGSKEADLALSREFILLYETTLNSPSHMSLTHALSKAYPPLMLKFTKNSKSTLKV